MAVVDKLLDKRIQELPLKTFFPNGYALQALAPHLHLDSKQLVKILELDTLSPDTRTTVNKSRKRDMTTFSQFFTGPKIKNQSRKTERGTDEEGDRERGARSDASTERQGEWTVSRAIDEWTAVHGDEATLGHFARQLVKHRRQDVIKMLLNPILSPISPMTERLRAYYGEPSPFIFDVYVTGADDDFAEYFQHVAGFNWGLKVTRYRRRDDTFFSNEEWMRSLMMQSRFLVLALASKPSMYGMVEDLAQRERDLAVSVSNCSPTIVMPVLCDEWAGVPADLLYYGVNPLMTQGEGLGSFCHRICETITDMKKELQITPDQPAKLPAETSFHWLYYRIMDFLVVALLLWGASYLFRALGW